MDENLRIVKLSQANRKHTDGWLESKLTKFRSYNLNIKLNKIAYLFEIFKLQFLNIEIQ